MSVHPLAHPTRWKWTRSELLCAYAGVWACVRAQMVEFNQAYWGHMDHNTDLIAPMYPYPHEIEAYAIGNGSMPLIMCEYAHAMGNSLGGFAEYWRIIRSHASLQVKSSQELKTLFAPSGHPGTKVEVA